MASLDCLNGIFSTILGHHIPWLLQSQFSSQPHIFHIKQLIPIKKDGPIFCKNTHHWKLKTENASSISLHWNLKLHPN